MTDKELLEMAAKAAGYEMNWLQDCQFIYGSDDWWDPLDDDKDAFRLAVALNILWDVKVHYTKYLDLSEMDKQKATRRAITRSAAEIGKEML